MATIDELIERLSDIEEIEELKAVEILKTKRSLLLEDIEYCCRASEKTANLLLETSETLLLLQTMIRVIEAKYTTAERR